AEDEVEVMGARIDDDRAGRLARVVAHRLALVLERHHAVRRDIFRVKDGAARIAAVTVALEGAGERLEEILGMGDATDRHGDAEHCRKYESATTHEWLPLAKIRPRWAENS